MPPALPSSKTSLANRVRQTVSWGLLVFGILMIGALVAENYRGHYAWKKYREAWEAKGERFDIASFIPKPVPPEQNFATTPFFAPYLDYVTDEKDRENPHHWKDEATYKHNLALAASISNLRSKLNKKAETGHWPLGVFTDLQAWQACFDGNTNFPFATTAKDPANDVLTALHKYDQMLDEIGAAILRHYSIFPVHYGEHFDALLPHLASLKGLARIVHLRTVARLEAGHAAEALNDVQLGLRLADSLKSEGFLISQLVRIGMAEIALQSIWEGLARQRWNEVQIAELQSALARINILEDYGVSMRTERAAAIQVVELLRTGKFRQLVRSSDDDEESPPDYSNTRFLPGGIFRQNQLSIARLYQEYFIPLVNQEKHRVDVQNADRGYDMLKERRSNPYSFIAGLLMPAVSKCALRFAYTQSGIDLALVACTLERHRLATGRYPDKRDALTPKYLAKLPPDVITGQPLKYRLTEDGHFLLYSVGWNERDDGGTFGLTARKQASDPRKGDWVWRYPASPVEGP